MFFMPDELLRYHPEFPILSRTTYLISNSLGAMPRGVEDSLQQYTELWNTRGVRAWDSAGLHKAMAKAAADTAPKTAADVILRIPIDPSALTIVRPK